MEKIQRNKGITLISLVVTIIILIILAGITINIILGKNGIIDKTQEAKIGTEIGREKEILQLAIGDIAAGNEGKLNFNKESLEKALKDNSGMDGITADKSSERLYIVTFPDSKRQYEVYADGTIADAAPKTEDNTPDSIEQKDENTYLIQSIEDLVILSNTVNAGTDSYEGKTFEIQCDLNFASVNSYINPEENDFGDANGDGTEETILIKELTESAGFMPIGTYGAPFKGNIEGNGHTISNLYINRSSYYQGFIGYVVNVIKVQNLNLTKINITGNGDVGGIVGCFNSVEETIEISNCQVSGKINGNSEIGALVGLVGDYETTEFDSMLKINNCKSNVEITSKNSMCGMLGKTMYIKRIEIENCENSGNITSSGSSGGIIGGIYSTNDEAIIKNCCNTGKINNAGSYVGGIVGESYYTQKTKIENCYNKGDVLGNSYVAGIIGRMAKTTTITECYNTASITGEYATGGIAGQYEEQIENGVTIQKCFNTGNIINIIKNGYGYSNTGGIVGNGSYMTIQMCYNAGNIINGYQSGGIVGSSSSNGKIQNCYNTGDIIGKEESPYTGGIIGYGSNVTIENVYNIGNIRTQAENETKGYIGGICCGYGNYVKNAYNLGNLNNKNYVTYAGGIVANKNSSTFENTYYLKGTADKAMNEDTIQDVAGQYEVVETKEAMIQKMITDLVTANPTIWREAKENENEGYPILDF